jgi:hypothetical protein
MISLSRGQVVSPSAPALMFVANVVGQAVPLVALDANGTPQPVAGAAISYSIFDMTTPEKEATPVLLAGPTAVDLVADVVTRNGQPLDLLNPWAGFYAPRWTVPSTAAVGRYGIRWTFSLANPRSYTSTFSNSEPPPSGTVTKVFEVAAAPSVAGTVPMYALIKDTRDALGCGLNVTDVSLQKAIVRASRMIERVTGRTFDARFSTQRLGGNSARKLQIGPPIVVVSSVGIDTEPTQSGDLAIELDLLRIYARHLTEGLTDPDDRENPLIEFVHSDDLYGIRFVPFRGISLRSLAFPIGVQNVHVRGFFGYTDPDGSPWGETPELIQHATRLIVARELPAIGSDAREDAQWRWRVTDQKTLNNEIKLADPRRWGEWFGDPELDSILASYVRPPRLGSA